jgi:enoyl-CoA hydratase
MALVSYQLKDGIATIAMDDGKANALSPAMLGEINGALDRADADKAAVVLTGRAGTFSAGFDLKVMSAGGAEAHKMLIMGFTLGERLLSFPHPVVIAVGGHAIAMGVFLLLSADHRIGVDGQYKVGANEVAIGLTMPHFGVETCRQRLAPAYFHRSVINAEIYTPAEAVTAGFMDRLVPEAQLMGEALAAATRLAKLPRATHRDTKLRAREQALKAIRAAIEKDDADFARMFAKKGSAASG